MRGCHVRSATFDQSRGRVGGGSDSGAVYLFEGDGASWVETEKFLPNDVSNAAYRFGTAVDIAHWVPDDGIAAELTYLVAGAPRADSSQGAIFLFRLNGSLWLPAGKLVDSDVGGGNDAGELGHSVALNDDDLIAGAPLDDQFGGNRGAAYIFGRTNLTNNWSEVSPALYPSAATPGDMFGASVALSAHLNVAVVGAPAPTNNGVTGRVFIYDGPGSPTVVADGAADDAYGSAVAVDDVMNLIAFGAKQDDDGGTRAGAVYFLARDDILSPWHDAGKLVASGATHDKEAGEAVALDQLSLIVGGGEEDALTAGAAYVYTRLEIFGDGFESGSTDLWSAAVPWVGRLRDRLRLRLGDRPAGWRPSARAQQLLEGERQRSRGGCRNRGRPA